MRPVDPRLLRRARSVRALIAALACLGVLDAAALVGQATLLADVISRFVLTPRPGASLTTDIMMLIGLGAVRAGIAWARELLAHNLKTIFANRFGKSRYLLRSVHGEVRGFLSDRYRRLDSRPIIEAFATAVRQKGALPYDGYVTDTKVAL